MTTTIFSLIFAISMIGVSESASGQGRERRREEIRDRSDTREKDHDDRDNYRKEKDHRDNDYGRKDHRNNHRHYDRREVRHVYHHDHRPVIVHHHVRPRYIYYRDYDVYYDYQRSVYISHSGRSWTVTHMAPPSMRYVDVRTARRYEVDYYNDDFPTYLVSRRPSYVRECDGR